MELTFLGTGAGDFPACEDESEASEHLRRARELGGRNLRQASSILLDPDVVVDFYSPQSLERAGVDVSGIRHLLITHGHWDHFQPRAILELVRGIPGGLDVYGSEAIGRSLDFADGNVWNGKRFAGAEPAPTWLSWTPPSGTLTSTGPAPAITTSTCWKKRSRSSARSDSSTREHASSGRISVSAK